MIRRLGLAVLVVVMMATSACGRQVTGLGQNQNLPSGQMLIRVSVAGTLDFTDFEYVIVFNTSGNGQEPFPNALQTGFANYSYALVFGGPAGLVQPQLLQYFINTGGASGLGVVARPVAPQLIQFQPNDNGTGNQFQVVFDRSILNLVSPVAPVNSTPAPTTPPQQTWNINFFTVNPTNAVAAPGTPIDSMGINGPTDVTFNLAIDTATAISTTAQKPSGGPVPSNPNAQLAGYTIINTP
jgi:hypothetical protein